MKPKRQTDRLYISGILTPDSYQWLLQHENASQIIRREIDKLRLGVCKSCDGLGVATEPQSILDTSRPRYHKPKSRADRPSVACKVTREQAKFVTDQGTQSEFLQDLVNKLRALECPDCLGTGVAGGVNPFFSRMGTKHLK